MFFLLLFACVTENSFPTQAASAACARMAECHEEDFEDTYDDREDCVDENEDILDCYSQSCEFDADGAMDYLTDVRLADCDDIDEAVFDFQDAYDDCDDLELGACLVGF